jgi:hypothetical protein
MQHPTPSESASFTSVVRAQLTTTSFKACTYFATEVATGKNVFVKGPYKSEAAARVAIRVAEFKREQDPSISLADIELRFLVPDGMDDCQYGHRMSLVDRSVGAWFQVSTSLIPDAAYPLPTKSKSSKSAWPVPVSVVDWAALDMHVKYSKEWGSSIYSTDPIAAWEFVRHILLAWFCGCGADLAFSNFFYNGATHSVTEVDHEDWAKTWKLSDTRVVSRRSAAAAQFMRYLGENAAKVNTWLSTVRPTHSVKTICASLATDVMVATTGTKRKASAPLVPPVPKRVAAATGIFVGKSDPKYRVGTDPWGYALTLRKSDMQKAIRRGDIRQALVAFYVCFNVPKIFPDNPSAKAIQTNILNRVIICAMEDIGVANNPLVLHIVCAIFAMTGGKGSERCGLTVERMIVAACKSKKVRIQSHMTHAYGEKNRVAAAAAGLELRDEPHKLLSDPNWFRLVRADPVRVWDRLGAKTNPLLYRVWKKAAQRNKQAVLQYALARAHFSAVGKVGKGAMVLGSLPPMPKELRGVRRNHEEAPPKDEAYDIHTSQGKHRHGSVGKTVFRTEGAMVSNLDKTIHDPVLEKLYVKSLY